MYASIDDWMFNPSECSDDETDETDDIDDICNEVFDECNGTTHPYIHTIAKAAKEYQHEPQESYISKYFWKL